MNIHTQQPMRLLVATDAWHPQVNGVVRTYEHFAKYAEAMGHEIAFLTPNSRPSMPCPTYPEIRLAMISRRGVRKEIERFQPEFIHVATEGPIGLATRNYCLRAGLPFTTSYHTRFPEYVAARVPVPVSWGYAYMRWFHNAGNGVMVSTDSLRDELAARGFTNIYSWTRGVDTELFRPRNERLFGSDAPVFMYVGRVAPEKNIGAFLDLDLPGKKVVVGPGPQLDSLRRRYPDVTFTGPKFGEELAAHFASADVFVFPSLTDTYGVVLLEALACGTPVAAYPVTGPKDVILHGRVGVLDEDLGRAARAALNIDRSACREFALKFSWEACTRQLLDNIRIAESEPLENCA
ncbi:glycosyltransferase involved in cell wall biosynthesis [Dichotomicrobium thermohalophilum]|uniref:Glycosyltransferase involved in cell wall biosynthesis n=2 Tax=Dichotomicrobium thermohalophilum TaxID=933063 RepID=A0A397QA28_9HYPH|nr:glycosyltransferase involved in cell wall biosynthesis [Dichotomicrobium thermohalophilum]